MKVEILYNETNYGLQREINEWLNSKNYNVIIDIKFSGQTYSNFEGTSKACAMIIYN